MPYKNITISKCISLILLTAITTVFVIQTGSAQSFKPDKLGRVLSPVFMEVMRSKGYQLVGSFDTITKAQPKLKKPPVIAARAYKDGRLTYIDLQGEDLRGKSVAERYSPVRVAENVRTDMPIDVSIPYVEMKEKFEQVVNDGKYGTRDIETKKIGLPVTYDGIAWMGNGLIQIKTGNLYGIATAGGKILLTPRYETINLTGINDKKGQPLYYSIRKDQKVGLMDATFKEIIPPGYDFISSASYHTTIFLASKARKYGLVAKNGKELTPMIYSRIRPAGNKLPIIVTLGDKSGLIDSTGKILIPPDYDYVELDYERKQFIINQKGRRGTADYTGKFIQKPDYDNVNQVGNGLAIVERDSKYGVIDASGKFIIPLEYDKLDYEYPIFAAKKGAISTLLNLQGKLALTAEYQELQLVNGLLLYKVNDTYGLMSKTGKKLMQLDYRHIYADHNYLVVWKDGKVGVIDTQNNIIVPIKYDRFRGGEGSSIKNGLIEAVLQRDRYLIDLYGNEVAN